MGRGIKAVEGNDIGGKRWKDGWDNKVGRNEEAAWVKKRCFERETN